MLEQEGLELGPGQPPRDPPAGDPPPSARPPDGSAGPDDELWGLGPDSPADPAGTESRARSRAAPPAAGGPGRDPPPPAELDEDDFLSDDEVIYGDFGPPDPDLPEPSGGALWSCTALIGGSLQMVTATVPPPPPRPLARSGG